MVDLLPPLPAIGSAIIQLFGPQEIGNKIVNGSFEDGLEGWGYQGQVEIVAGGPDGTQHLRITGDDVTAYPQVVQVVPVIPGETYTLSGWIGSFGNQAVVYLRADAWLDGGGSQDFLMNIQRDSAGDTEMTHYESTAVIPENSHQLQILAYIGSSPSISGQDGHWDGLSLKHVVKGEWRDVTPQSVNAQISWGTDDNAGALSLTSAGSWSIVTYDPERLLDPANTASEFLSYLTPGGLVRLVFRQPGLPDEQVRLGFIDEIDFDIATKQGTIRATDAISLLVKAKLPDGLEHDVSAPTSLRARAAWVMEKAQVDFVSVEGFGNCIPAGGAEGYPDAYATLPEGWSLAYGGGTLGTATGAHSGTRAYNLRPSAPPVAFVGEGLKLEQKVVGGTEYRLEAWRLRENWGDGVVEIWIDFWDGEGVKIGNSQQVLNSKLTFPMGQSADTWHYLSTPPFRLPVECVYVTLVIQGTSGGGSHWIDDIALVGALPTTSDLLNGGGSFEDPAMPGWSNNTGDPTSGSVDYAVPVDGLRCLVVKGGVNAYPKYLSPGVPIIPGATYVISGWVYSIAGSKFATLGLQPRNSGGGAVGGGPYMAGTVSDRWEFVTGIYVAPTDGSVATVQADCRVNTSAIAVADVTYFDGVTIQVYEVDPVIGPPLNGIASAWQHITAAAFDALNAVWLDRNGILRFRYFGAPRVTNVAFGAGAGGMEIESIDTKLSMENVYNHFKAQNDRIFTDSFNNWEVRRQDSIDVYGDLLIERGHRNPDAWKWLHQLERDRGAAATQYGIATIRPQTPEQLMQLLDLGMIDQVWLYADRHGTIIDKRLNVLGGRFEANTDSGWSAGIVTYTPAFQWNTYPPTVQQRRVTNSGREIWTAFGGGAFGRSDSAQQEVRISQMAQGGDERHAILMGFPTPDWTGIAKIVDVMLQMYRPYHVDSITEGYGWFNVRRITEPWDESAVWPGPATTTDGENYAACEYFIPIWFEIQVLNIVKAWAPPSLGGISAPNYGVKLEPKYDLDNTQHVLISTKLSDDKPYLMLTMEAGVPPALRDNLPPRPRPSAIDLLNGRTWDDQ